MCWQFPAGNSCYSAKRGALLALDRIEQLFAVEQSMIYPPLLFQPEDCPHWWSPHQYGFRLFGEEDRVASDCRYGYDLIAPRKEA